MSLQKPAAERTQVKILMLHGYTQSGPLFHAKTRALEKQLVKLLAPSNLHPQLSYPTAPNRLSPRDVPGFAPSPRPPTSTNGGDDDNNRNGHHGAVHDDDEEDDASRPEMWAWFRKDEASGSYRLLAEGMAAVAAAIRDAGGVDAVCGFSQGAALAALVAAALEPNRPLPDIDSTMAPTITAPSAKTSAAAAAALDWVTPLRAANNNLPLRFAIAYSGFWAPVANLAWCYDPPISTPTLHVLGSLDVVVDHDRSQALIDRCRDPVVVTHPGGHHVPIAREWTVPLASFILEHARGQQVHQPSL